MWNSVSWNPTPKECILIAKVVTKNEHTKYVDQPASIPMGET